MAYKELYGTSIEVKYITAYFLRRLEETKKYISTCESKELVEKFNEVVDRCNELYDMSSKLAISEKPTERLIVNPDRGVQDFIDNCGGGDDKCGSGCGGCGGGCKP